MHDRDKIDRLNKLAGQLFIESKEKFSGQDHPPFDISLVALHQHKGQFTVELKIVKSMVRHLESVLHVMGDARDNKGTAKERIQKAVDKAIRSGTRRRKLRGGSSRDLVIQNIRETGFFEGSLEVLEDMLFAYRSVLDELLAQQEMFWSMAHRPPDHFARMIVLRFARLFHRETGKMPTLGTSSQGGHPATDFSLALEKIFTILEIETKPRLPAEWAKEQFEEEIRERRRPFELGIDPIELAKLTSKTKDTPGSDG